MALKDVCYQGQNYGIVYDIFNHDQTKDILFLHGWGSNKELMEKAFTPFLKEYRQIYIDMPGFGKSSNENALFTRDYAMIIQTFLTQIHVDLSKLLVVGHSFGGKVAVLLSSPYITLLSSAGILQPKSWNVKCKIILSKISHLLGLKRFTRLLRSCDVVGMQENMYQTFKNVVNEDFTDVFKNVQANTLILWGEHDEATPKKSGEQIASLIPNNTFYSFQGDHYFFLQHPQEVCLCIQKHFSTQQGEY